MMEIHGWGDFTPTLHQMSRRGEWEAMTGLITDEMVDAFTVAGYYGEIGRKLRQRWEECATRVDISIDVLTSANHDERQQMVREIQGG
jgi:hypothetical protein